MQKGKTHNRWEHLRTQDLLNERLCDLRLTVRTSFLQPQINQLLIEVSERQLLIRPSFWLSDEWFCPDDHTGISIPFYLSHPRLALLEQRYIGEVEGGTAETCRQLLRHEMGHVVDNAFCLRMDSEREALFGSSKVRYPATYDPRPYSRSYVRHIKGYYAQSHPDEDFAETFAVWLTPRLNWRKKYQSWPALRKLEFINRKMRHLAGRRPPILNPQPVDPISGQTITLGDYLRRKRSLYGAFGGRMEQDRQLYRIFCRQSGRRSAVDFMRQHREMVCKKVAEELGEYEYRVNWAYSQLAKRAQHLNLKLGPKKSAHKARTEFKKVLKSYVQNSCLSYSM